MFYHSLASMAISLLYLAIVVFVGLRRLLQFLRKLEDSPSRSLWKYDVLLSFRGTDVRKSFVSHLYEALNNGGVKTFHDDRELQKGTFIWEGLEKEIDQSRFATVNFKKFEIEHPLKRCRVNAKLCSFNHINLSVLKCKVGENEIESSSTFVMMRSSERQNRRS